MKITIDTKDNGAVVSWTEEVGEGEFQLREQVYKFDAWRGGVAEECCIPDDYLSMLSDLNELLGMLGGRYDKERVHIGVQHGDKYECKKKCLFCRVEK